MEAPSRDAHLLLSNTAGSMFQSPPTTNGREWTANTPPNCLRMAQVSSERPSECRKYTEATSDPPLTHARQCATMALQGTTG
eukprot:15433010-Alexandrium_andersonii.AAC.1